jgi:uncharacterized protein with NAD-binding domain and iron-sulfur cluster
MAQTVAILGGGVGGLSAAHELAERGFQVRVYERKPIFGGKARSVTVPGTGAAGRGDLPGEHGFRFFPSFYKHLPDTMARIPYGTNRRGVLDNLVPASRSMLARVGSPDVALISRFPRTIEDWTMSVIAALQLGTTIPPDEIVYYVSRLLIFLSSCEERRVTEYEHIPWWEFTGAATRSAPYQEFLGRGLTRSLVAIRAEEGSTRTVGTVGLQLGLGLLTFGTDVDRLLCGPTNEVWIDPWVRYLRGLGVQFYEGTPVQRIHTDGRQITGVTVEQAGRPVDVTADYYIAALPVEVMLGLLTDDLRQAVPSLARIGQLRTAWMNGIQFYLADDVPIVHGHAIYADSPWALTSISQHQFWGRIDLAGYGDGRVHGLLSVDISDWEAPGLLFGRPAKECTAEEIRQEVWAQILAHLDGADRERLAGVEVLHWFLDPDIEWPNPSAVTNLEPLLINTIGSLADRPHARTELPNLFLAADYIRTHTDLACMEAANEAARRAVNALLAMAGSPAPRARIWPLEEPLCFAPLKAWDRCLFALGLPHASVFPEAFLRGMAKRLLA